MNKFYLVVNTQLIELGCLDHHTCGRLMAWAPSHLLTKDLEAWVTKAKHGDAFEISHNRHVICLNLVLFIRAGLNHQSAEAGVFCCEKDPCVCRKIGEDGY